MGTSYFGGVDSSPTLVILLTFLYTVLFSFNLNTCKGYLPPSFMLLITKHTGRMDEWSLSLCQGTSHLGGVGSSPTPVVLLTFL